MSSPLTPKQKHRVVEAGPSTTPLHHSSTPAHHSSTRSSTQTPLHSRETERDGFEDITYILTSSDGDASRDDDGDGEQEEDDDLIFSPTELTQTDRPRQNSYDYVITLFRAQEEQVSIPSPSPAHPPRSPFREPNPSIPMPTKPQRAHRPVRSRLRLRDFLPGFEGDVDRDPEELELGLWPNAVGERDEYLPQSREGGSAAGGAASGVVGGGSGARKSLSRRIKGWVSGKRSVAVQSFSHASVRLDGERNVRMAH